MSESEWTTRKNRIDPRLDAAGWSLSSSVPALAGAHRREEHPTDAGPADYTLCDGERVLAVVEAKKLSLGPQNVLTQAERYSLGLRENPNRYGVSGEFRVPFLYATNGEVTWFHDVRHPQNRSRRVADFHTPAALREWSAHDVGAALDRLAALPNDGPRLRPYQRDANTAVEAALGHRRRSMLVAMATGTGKTFTMVNQVYRLLRSGVARRVLFLVDRRALAAQAVRAFASFEPEPGLKFDKLYEVYSGRFHREDLDEDDHFDNSVLPTNYLCAPKPGLTFVYVCTIQRMAINVLGRDAVPGLGEERIDDDAERLDIPIHAFDVVIADECHRGYTGQQASVWRDTLDHFDAVKIGLTATPAAHTTAYFKDLVFRYDYAQAVRDGHLVDYDAISLRSQVRMKGVFLQEGEDIEVVDPATGTMRRDTMEDERQFQPADIEEHVTAPLSNRRILEEIKRYTDRHEEAHGRFPKTLIFAANDLPHTSHADQLVDLARDVFGRGESFVQKITGRVDRPLQRIREFRNRPSPGIAVTVDLLSTGVDIPDLEFIVFLRTVQSRILFEQMLGRGTRKGEHHRDKSRFVVFDCFDGTLLAYFARATGITAEAPVGPTRTIPEIVEAIWDNRDRDYNIGCLVKRLHRVDRTMSGDARELFARFVPDGDVAAYARGLKDALMRAFAAEMKRLRDPAFLALLQDYPRPQRTFVRAPGIDDTVSSEWMLPGPDGTPIRPEEYLESFARFVREERDRLDALSVLLRRPADWSPQVLAELRDRLVAHPLAFTRDRLEKAHEARYHRALVDIISMVKHAADEQAPLLTASERVERVFASLRARHTFTGAQSDWLDRIREHLRENLSIDRQDFEDLPVLERHGGWAAAAEAFGADLPALLRTLNEAMAA